MDYSEIKEKMQKSIDSLKERLSEVRAGRANPAILNKVKIDYYGTPTPINQVAGVSVPEARMIVIQPWDISVLKDIEKAFPIVSEVLIDERNKILAQNIKKAPGKKIFAIVGAAHIPGILKYINEDIDITEINNKVIKPKSSKIKGWIIPALIISMIAITCFKNFDQAKNQMLVWLIVNGGLSALGALIAFAHPLSVITAFIAAPITSLNPLLAAGWFAGIMEAYLRKPKVSDLQNIDEAANSLKGLYQNRFTHVLIVVILANIGSSIGTFIAGLDIFKSFISIFN